MCKPCLIVKGTTVEASKRWQWRKKGHHPHKLKASQDNLGSGILTQLNFDYMANAMQDAQIVLAKMAYAQWLKVHGKLKRPEMSKKQELELKECFELMDAGGSGVIALHDVPLAFTVLGMDMKRPEIDVVLAGVNNRIIAYPQFMQIMMAKLDKLPQDSYAPRDDGKDPSTQYSLPFSLLAQAYRRKKLIEAVMGGDRPLQDRMNYRSGQVAKDRQELRDAAAGKPKKLLRYDKKNKHAWWLEALQCLHLEPKKNWPMTLSKSQREKRRARPAKSKKIENNDKTAELVHIPHYLLDTMSADVKEVLLRNKSTRLKTNGTVPETKIMPSGDNISDEIRPWTVGGDNKVNDAYMQEKLKTFRSLIRHKPTLKQQVVHAQATRTLRNFFNHGFWETNGSPLAFPASQRPTTG